MPTAATLVLGMWLASGLAAPAAVSRLLDRLDGADLVLTNDPIAARPVRVLLATRVAARTEKIRQVVVKPDSYKKAMPAFRRVDVVSRRVKAPGKVDLEVAWELDVPLWNLEGKLWLRPRADGVDLELAEGDFAPGLFHVLVRPAPGKGRRSSILTIEGQANVRDANMATRQLVKRSPLAEPAMTVAAAYVMLKSLAGLAESGAVVRPKADMSVPELSVLDGARTGAAASMRPRAAALLAAVRSRADGRLARVEVALSLPARAAARTVSGLSFEALSALPGWKKVEVQRQAPRICTDPVSPCYVVDTDLPLFSLDGTWKLRRHPWRARMVAGDREGAFLGIDIVPARAKASSVLVLSEHPRLDRAGYAARKLIAAEPYLEHGLALALTIVDAVSLVPSLARR
jgi:hypothetical protein